MAEFVEFRVEEMIPELEQLGRLRIFNETEIRNIIKTRKKHQYKVQKRTKCLDDFIRYILYEMDLLRLVKTRRIKLGIKEKKNELEMVIANRVNKLFEQAIFRFHEDINLWLSYMKFCKQVQVFSVCVSNMLVGMLAVHNHKPGLWKLAASWEFEENKNIENATQFLMRGLRYHPTSKALYLEAFRIYLTYWERQCNELKSTESVDNPEEMQSCISSTSDAGASTSGSVEAKMRLLQEPLDITSLAEDPSACSGPYDAARAFRLAEFIYETASLKVREIVFLIHLLDIAKNFPGTEKLQTQMSKNLLTWFPRDELTWDTLARRELEGYHFFSTQPKPEVPQNIHLDEQAFRTEVERVQYKRIRHCYTIYQRGMMYLETKRMHKFYLETLLQMHENATVLKKCKRRLLVDGFRKAHILGFMQEKYYIYWAHLNIHNKDEAVFVLDAATEKCPKSANLWLMRLRFHLTENGDKVALPIFKKAIEQLGNNNPSALNLWKMMIQYYQTKSGNKVKGMFQEGIKQGPAISNELKLMYLEWLALAKNITTARLVYASMCEKPPYYYKLHQKMAALECLQPEVDMKKVVKCYEFACEQSGRQYTDVWLEYIKFEIRRGDPKKVKDIYLQALKTLDGELAHNFISQFCALVKPRE